MKYTPEHVWPTFQALFGNWWEEYQHRNPGKHYYVRLYPVLLVLWGYIFQRLNHDHTCDAFVSRLISGEQWHELLPAVDKPRSDNTAAYCKARKRLPYGAAVGALQHVAEETYLQNGEEGLWHGYQVCLIDGSTIRLQSEADLIAYYKQPGGKFGQSHWPRMRVVAAFDLFSGIAVMVEEGAYTIDERALARNLIRRLERATIFVGDRYYGEYRMVQVVTAFNHQAIFRMRAEWVQKWLRASAQPSNDMDICWQPSNACYREKELPGDPIPGRLLYYRIERPGFRPKDLYLFTTLVDRTLFSYQAILEKYGYRWHAELNLRYVKTIMEMENLTAKSVDMVRKELVLGFLAYNLIRILMGLAARQVNISPLRLSFTRCLRRIVDTPDLLLGCESIPNYIDKFTTLLLRLGKCKLPNRVIDRFEPRRVWLKPRQYPYFTKDRLSTCSSDLQRLMAKS
jgi:hypothetical protein